MKAPIRALFALLFVIMLGTTAMAAERMTENEAYVLAGEWLRDAQKFLEGHPWTVTSNQWSIVEPERSGTITMYHEEKRGKTELIIRYRISDEKFDLMYRWLRPGDLITLTVRATERDRMSLRDEIMRREGKLDPIEQYYYERSYISGVVLAPAK